MTGRGWISKKFAEFLVELERQRIAVQQGRAELPSGSRPSGPWIALQTLLSRQRDRADRKGGNLVSRYRDAQLAFCALADEVFTAHLDWRGRDAWKRQPLQKEFFETQKGGELIFEKIEQLVNDPARDEEVTRIYQHILSLGFKGKHALTPGGDAQIEKLRSRLFTALDPAVEASRQASPRAYEGILRERSAIPLPDTRQALILLGLVIGLLLLVGTSTGYLLQSGVRGQLESLDRELTRSARAPQLSEESKQ